MNKSKFGLIIASFLLIVLASCNNDRDNLLKQIIEVESNFKSQTDETNKVLGQKLINLYSEFTTNYKNDSLTPEMLYKAAQVSVAIDRNLQSLDFLENIIQNYSENENLLAEVYVYKGFIYETEFNDLVNARKYYSIFLTKFPNHHLYESIYQNLQVLGKTPEQLIEEFKKQENQTN